MLPSSGRNRTVPWESSAPMNPCTVALRSLFSWIMPRTAFSWSFSCLNCSFCVDKAVTVCSRFILGLVVSQSTNKHPTHRMFWPKGFSPEEHWRRVWSPLFFYGAQSIASIFFHEVQLPLTFFLSSSSFLHFYQSSLVLSFSRASATKSVLWLFSQMSALISNSQDSDMKVKVECTH